MVVTYRDIARAAGVSTATVSRVLSGAGGFVRPELVEHVRETAQELGYRSHRAARALRRQRSDAIGLVVSDVENPFFAAIARAVEDVAAEHRHAVLLCNTDEDLAQEDLYLDLLVGERVAGVIVAPSTEELGPLGQLVEAGIPTVTVDRKVGDGTFDSVLLDNRPGAVALVEDLLAHGHRRIGVIVGTTAATPSRERLAGCQEAVAAVAGASLVVGEGQLRDAIGTAGTMELAGRLALDMLSAADPPTALFCGNGLLAQGVLLALRHSGRRVPDDVAVVGFDDLPLFQLLDRPQTVAAQPTDRIGRAAAELLFRRIDDPDRPAEAVVLPPELRWRASCGGDHSTTERK
ncbi:LacI family DNA-binding transcriptional regulator [Phytohabitans kaempferiae]|uniref:LacI family DNA-binding transcriptional regulator n=1 Tax=Phytohabitans kaempferiae TaxID=1620943 RepID=A0ABV6M9I6_9ACTN